MLLRSQFYFTTDMSYILNNYLNNPNVVVCVVSSEISLDNILPYGIQADNIISLSVLCPPFHIITKDVDNETELFYQGYMQYLDSQDLMDVHTSILTAMSNGKLIIFYTTPDEYSGLRFTQVISNYYLNRFGISIGTDANPYSYNPIFDMSNAELMFLYEKIDPQLYINILSSVDNYIPNEMVLLKLRQLMMPYIPELMYAQTPLDIKKCIDTIVNQNKHYENLVMPVKIS